MCKYSNNWNIYYGVVTYSLCFLFPGFFFFNCLSSFVLVFHAAIICYKSCFPNIKTLKLHNMANIQGSLVLFFPTEMSQWSFFFTFSFKYIVTIVAQKLTSFSAQCMCFVSRLSQSFFPILFDSSVLKSHDLIPEFRSSFHCIDEFFQSAKVWPLLFSYYFLTSFCFCHLFIVFCSLREFLVIEVWVFLADLLVFFFCSLFSSPLTFKFSF